MGSSFSSWREPLVHHAGDMTGSTDRGLHQLSMTSRKIPQIPNKKTVKLCIRCKMINMKDFFDHEAPSMARKPNQLLYLGKLKQETKCVLCQFFYSMRCQKTESHDETEVYTLRSFLLGNVYTPSVAYFASHYAPSMVLCVIPGKAKGSEDGLFRWTRGNCYIKVLSEIGWIVPQSFTAAPFFSHKKPSLSALPFSTTSINYPLLRAWCGHCETHHDTCASARKAKHMSDKQGLGPAVRCIDCHTREIVEIQTSDRYFALSYVWGEQPSPGSGCTSGARETASVRGARQLPNVIPKVIEDAMIVVANLGDRYLWVDQYCIDQNDEDDKHAQIGNMAAIYEGAYATIVAFSTPDSASGLPGVRNLARKPYPSVAHPKHPLSALRPSVISSPKLASSSVWMTRGWTYQEAILSRRLLIFTDYQVEFICSDAVWHECTLPIPLPPKINLSYGSENFLEAITPMERSADKIPLHMAVLNKCIEEYSGRRLTHQSDVLNAITGLLSRISTLTYLGIPILQQLELTAILPLRQSATSKQALWRFLAGLAWCPADKEGIPLRRRDAFPSWSWLGWEGRITFPSLIAFDGKSFSPHAPRACASVWIANQVTQTKGETLVPLVHLLEEAPLGKESTSILPHLTNYLWVEGAVIKMAFTKGRGDESGVLVPKSFHPPMRSRSDKTRISFRNCSSDRPSQGTVYQRILTEQWDCLLLVTRDSFPSQDAYFLILDQVQGDETTEAENCHYAVGSAELVISLRGGDPPWDDPSLRRKIKLC
ncbi:heterokaryon incompatibility protein-domain-containing protein [Neurospora hispaniola]|uniref:Heterokaryon incompatibility protein-domain-containing protein n=1 Tax=Neurospora hispaniola TaxID=588809 RepID=A0AAJ0MPY0_9PEZI|nr:heterokaryon incompatibility protein-domain-containing protein [Neurospora hispaniola]